MVEKVTKTETEALDRYTPKIKTRTLPHPEIDEEMKTKMEDFPFERNQF